MKTCHSGKIYVNLAGNYIFAGVIVLLENLWISNVKLIFGFYRHLSEEGLDIVSENGQIEDINILTKKALDVSG